MEVIQSTVPELYELLDLEDFAQVENMKAPVFFLTNEHTRVFFN